MADTLSERLRKQLHGTPFSPNNCPCYLCDLYREAAAELDRREARLTALEQALQKQERINELLQHQLDRNVPCSDHRDKISPGVCPICEAEQRTVARLKAEAALKG